MVDVGVAESCLVVIRLVGVELRAWWVVAASLKGASMCNGAL